MAEIKGTGPMEYNKVMTTSFRTYGYFWLYESIKNLPEGFIVNATPGNQLYRGYDYEVAYPRIKEAAKMTRGNILTSSQSEFKDNVAITPYSSWTDGRTRSFEERWGGTDYPWCQSVADPYGKHPTMTTAQLEAAGNHMVGLSANGALKLAGTSYNWAWDRILKYYYTGVSLSQIY
jgi:peptidoglycan hydrolase-like amidase